MLSRPDTFESDVVAARPMLRRMAISLCRDATRAEDLVQDTILRALTHRATFQPGTNVSAWLVTILKNTFLSGRRRSYRIVEDPDDKMANSMPTECDPRLKLEAVEVLRLVDKLPEQFKRPLLMLADGATYEEIADEVHEHVGTVKSRIHRARSMLSPEHNRGSA